MWLIVGLGNPDPEYQWTPHNLGFMAVGELANRNGIRVERAEGKGRAGRGKNGGGEEMLAELEIAAEMIGEAGDAVEMILKQGIDAAMNQYNRRKAAESEEPEEK